MKTERIAAKVLWSLTVLITFILVFEKELVLPAWIQSVGRMHPLLLHFPIVVLLFGTGFELFGLVKKNDSLHATVRITWLVGALTAGVTVVMGIFLSQEDGYTGNTLSWHKWSGAAVFYLASLFYFLSANPRFLLFKKGIAVATALLLLVSGHFGAELTHGEGFISQPLIRESGGSAVPIEQAIVFDHVVLPILDAKCTSCHNSEKAKGELILTDSAAIMKGGKTGPLIKALEPALSLLMERVHLPLEDKKHMPPKGKPQLTPEEEAVLIAWIKAGTPYSSKVTAIASQDSLSILARKRLKPSVERQEVAYDFKAADEKEIRQLNNEYRNVAPFSFNSPALSVDLYGSQVYTVKLLEELTPVKKQVVSLNVSRMPVKDQDLKVVAGFENLRQLNLNFTEVTTKGLTSLTGLKKLETLYLAGVPLEEEAFQKFLKGVNSLRHVSLWETGIREDQLAAVRKQFPGIAFLSDYNPGDTTRLQLNKPLARSDAWVFGDKSKIDLFHPVREVTIRYTLDGTDPDSSSKTAGGPLDVSQTSNVRVKAFKDGWYPSEVAEFQLYRNTYKPDSVFLLNRLNRVHLAEGAHTFFDKQLGAIGANNPAWANHFAGVRDNDLELLCWFNKPIDLTTVGIRIMVEEETSIYPPGVIEIWGGENENQLRLIAKNVSPDLPEPREKPTLRKIDLPVKKGAPLKCLKIVAKPYQKPNERPKLVLIDEMFLN